MFRKRLAGVVMLAALAGMIGGCSAGADHPESQAERVVRGVPEGWTGPGPDLVEGTPTAGWVSADEFGIITIGSGSCPPVADALQVISSSEVRISFADSPHDPCTADMGATTHIFRLPPSVDGRPVNVGIGFGDGDGDGDGERHSLSLP